MDHVCALEDRISRFCFVLRSYAFQAVKALFVLLHPGHHLDLLLPADLLLKPRFVAGGINHEHVIAKLMLFHSMMTNVFMLFVKAAGFVRRGMLISSAFQFLIDVSLDGLLHKLHYPEHLSHRIQVFRPIWLGVHEVGN